jgi:hypothetical protein
MILPWTFPGATGWWQRRGSGHPSRVQKKSGFDHQNMEINRGIYIGNKNGDLVVGFNSTNMAIYIKVQVQLDKCCLNFGR